MIRFLIKKKIVKNEKVAIAALLALAVVLIVLSGFLIHKSSIIIPAIIDPSLNSINK